MSAAGGRGAPEKREATMERVPTILFVIVAWALLASLPTAVVAQDCWMGIMFDGEDGLVDTVEPTSLTLDAHLVLDTTAAAVSGYEAGIAIGNPAIFVLGVVTPPGWVNFGTVLDQIVAFSEPLPAGGTVVLCTVQLLLTGGPGAELCVVAVEPSSFEPPAPGFWDGGGDPHPCEGRCGYITSPVNAEAHAFGAVKALFD
jgi:hypothetical protein